MSKLRKFLPAQAVGKPYIADFPINKPFDLKVAAIGKPNWYKYIPFLRPNQRFAIRILNISILGMFSHIPIAKNVELSELEIADSNPDDVSLSGVLLNGLYDRYVVEGAIDHLGKGVISVVDSRVITFNRMPTGYARIEIISLDKPFNIKEEVLSGIDQIKQRIRNGIY